MTKVLVAGGRDFTSYSLVDLVLTYISNSIHITSIISGGARGVDSLAEKWANNNNIDTCIYPANWNKYGKRAGYIRNKQMLDEGKPDIVVLLPGGRGTNMMADLSYNGNFTVYDYRS